MIKLHQLPKITTKKKKRAGRGIAQGKGKTAGRGTKGQLSRSGTSLPAKFEGGQMALIYRLPKLGGFKSRRLKPQIVNLDQLDRVFKKGEKVTPQSLFEKGLIRDARKSVKILGKGQLTKKFVFQNVSLSRKVTKASKKE